jgi:Glycosyltransferase like family
MKPITFVVATNDRETLDRNFLASPCIGGEHPHQILLQENFPSAATAYNDAIDRSANDLMVFVHQDIYLPETWPADVEAALERLEETDPHWGVLGCYGQTEANEGRGHVYDSGLGVIWKPFRRPARVQTLDEIVLILRKSSGLRFDESIPHFHMYGADICLQAAERGMTSYAISAFCVHNTYRSVALPKEFYDCYRHVRRKWKGALPIYTPCIEVTRFNVAMYYMRIRETYHTYVLQKKASERRIPETETLLRQVDSALRRAPIKASVRVRPGATARGGQLAR